MATAYTNLLGFALPVTGELNGTWGDVVNNSITELVEDSIAGSATASVTSGDWTLTTTGSGVANQARAAILIPTGTPGVARSILAPNSSKAYIVDNQSDAAVTLKGATGPTTGVAIAAGTAALAVWDGSDFVLVAQNLANASGTLSAANGGTGLTSPGASGNILTSNGTAWTSAAPAPGGIDYVVKTANYTTQNNEGVLADTSGGAFTVTLPATPSVGDQCIVADAGASFGTNNLTVGRNGSTIGGLAENLIIDITGVSVQLVYDGTTWEVYAQIGGNGGSINLATQVTGTLPVANGGTGAATLTANNVLLGNGTSALQAIAPSTSGNVLTSNGTTWTSSTPAGGGFAVTTTLTNSQTWTIPANVKTIKVTVVGGGGGGGGGENGGTSSIASGTQTISTVSATGGFGGTGIVNGANGGIGSGGDLNIAGNGSQSGTSDASFSGSTGGGSFFGGGATGSRSTANNGRNYGGGGNAMQNGSSQPESAGGGGGCAIKYLSGLTPGNTLTVTIGAGGTAGTYGGAGSQGVVVIEY